MINSTKADIAGCFSEQRPRASLLSAIRLASLSCVFLSTCGGGGSSPPPGPSCTLGVSMGYAPITTSVLAGDPPIYNDGGGDGSAGAGGDGGGAGAGGGLGAFKRALVRVERADRTVVGSDLTDSYGMVSIKDCGGTQPLLVTVQGSSIATYWDEAAQSDLPFPSTESMHAMVAPAAPGQQTLSKNVGI